jgi:hypothetical protein
LTQSRYEVSLPVLETPASLGGVAVPSSLAVAYTGTTNGHSARSGKRAPVNTPPANRLSPVRFACPVDSGAKAGGRRRREQQRQPEPDAKRGDGKITALEDNRAQHGNRRDASHSDRDRARRQTLASGLITGAASRAAAS